MSQPQLSIASARVLHLAAQGLLAPLRRKAKKDDVLAAIRRMALLQIDTIHVIARSPYFVLWSRLGAYEQRWLDELLVERRIFEYWAHEACFVPSEDYGLLRHHMLDPSSTGWKSWGQWMERDREAIEAVIAGIREHGPVRAADFGRREGGGNGWWDWRPEKRHLEVLFAYGRLMVAERRNFQRVYDLAERVRPGWDDSRDLLPIEVVRHERVRRSCRALGIVRASWVGDYYRIKRLKAEAALDALVEAGELIPVRVEDWRQPVFVHCSLHDALVAAEAGTLKSTVTTLLSPFDPVVWDRKRALELFDFDYRIECYTPAPKRKYGYFVLPILHRGRLVGRLDAKAHRVEGVFEVKALFIEPGVKSTQRLVAELDAALARCALWHGCGVVRISAPSIPGALKDLMRPGV